MLQCSPDGAESCSAMVIDLGTLHNINENRTSLTGSPGCLGEFSNQMKLSSPRDEVKLYVGGCQVPCARSFSRLWRSQWYSCQ